MFVFGSGRCMKRVGEWMRGLGLSCTNSVGTGGVLAVCLGWSGVGREWETACSFTACRLCILEPKFFHHLTHYTSSTRCVSNI